MAAPYVENGGHQGANFLSNQFPGLYFTDFDDSAGAFTSQQSILTQNDNSYMNDFWSNPEKATAEKFPHWPGVDHKVNSGMLGGQMDGVDDRGQIIHDPGVTFAGASNSLTQAQIGDPSGHMSTSHLEFGADELGQGSEDDFKAASGLVDMSLQAQGHSRPLSHSDGLMPTHWDILQNAAAFNNVHMQDNITSPITSSGRQSANSYHSQPQTAYMHNHMQDSLSNHQFSNYNWMQGTQQAVQQNIPRPRPASYQYDMNNFMYPSNNTQQGPMPHSALPYNHDRSRPALARFGSDDHFSRAGYRGPHNSISLEEEKQGNLINVPLAAQAAANGHAHVQAHMPYMNQQLQHSHHPVAGGSRHMQSMSAASSPGAHVGGLPLNSPSFNAHMPGNLYPATVPQQQVDDEDYEDSDEELAYPEEQARKRRKSQMERDDDGDYYPSGQSKAAVRKREGNANIAMQDSDEEYTATVKSSAGKRRKSSMAGVRPTLGSSNGNSPSFRPSPVAKQTPVGSKKKSRDTEPRKNLTEDQKRKNHIHSEKQRRDLIKVQYDALDNLVPALKGGKSGLSRSDVLQEIVSYVESIAEGNIAMERILKNIYGVERVDASRMDADEAV